MPGQKLILNQTKHFYPRFSKDSHTAAQQGSCVKTKVKDEIGDLPVLWLGS